MFRDLSFYVLTIILFFFNMTKWIGIDGNLNISNDKIENTYISIDKNNINEFINVKENEFFFNMNCKTSRMFNNMKNYMINKVYTSLESFRSENVTSSDIETIEDIIERTWDRENKEFIFTTKRLIKQYTDNNLFILQVGLNSVAPLILDKPENGIFIEEDIEICKNYFLHKPNKCFLYLEGVEFYCKKKTTNNDNHNDSSNLLKTKKREDIFDTLDLISKIYQNKNNEVIDILIVNHKYPVALLYYIYPYLDSSTLVILMDNLNHQMKTAIFEYYDFIGEADFSKGFEKKFFNLYKSEQKKKKKEQNNNNIKKVDNQKNDNLHSDHNTTNNGDMKQNENYHILNKNYDDKTKKYEANENLYIYNKMKQSPFYVITLNPKSIMNPPQNRYKLYISNEYTSSYQTQINIMIKDIEKLLKLNKKFYEQHKVLVTNYFAVINEYEFDDNNIVKSNVTNTLTSILTSFAHTGDINPNNYQYALENLKNIFSTMLYTIYERSKFKALFNPLMDFFKLYLNKDDPNYIIYQFLIYGLIKNSREIESYELKEIFFLDVLRDVSKQINKMSITEVVLLVTKLNILLKKIRSREDITHIKDYAKKHINIDYTNNEL
ncbi:hypothetical protein PGSY75_0909600 [Plasmodium gaboni]|uniref:Uncharacterized protein n=1 Tax=Plasmodium gaboni TaxID=647221 RepID=A0A151LLR5_9APIC|nr:hypothetical protein PGSY75_0909600 [Plasmodium gaboni]KYO00086.1 hypothetical protein PGSY75_0909600 [Plasmodium gaboni]